MADTKTRRKRDDPEKVRAAIEAIAEYYDLGNVTYEERKELEEEEKMSGELLRKARSVANTFKKSEIDEVARLCVKHEFALGRTHLDRLATLEDKRERMELTRTAIRERWSRLALDAAIRTQFGSRHRNPKLGRLPRQPSDKDDAIAELSRLALRVVRYGEMLGWEHPEAMRSRPMGKVTLAKLPGNVRKRSEAVFQACVKLMEAAQAELGHQARGN